jgi:hypothetical protein
MTKRAGGVSALALILVTTACLKANKPTAYTTEDVIGVARTSYSPGLSLRGHVVRTNPQAQMITITVEGGAPPELPAGHGAGGHGSAAELIVPVEGQAVAALRTLRPGQSVAVTCRAVDSPSLEARSALGSVPAAAPVAVASPLTVLPPVVHAPAPAASPVPGAAEVAVAPPVVVTTPDPHAASAGRATVDPHLLAGPGPMGGGATAGLFGLSARCPSVIKVEAQGH